MQGLVKFDILGLTALTVISKTLKMLKSRGVELDISKINLVDEEVLNYYLPEKQQVFFSSRVQA